MSARLQWALVIVGAWIMGSICLSVVATQNFYTIDRLLKTSTKPQFYAAVQKLGQDQARDLLRYLSSELNRLYFQGWNVTQIVFGVLTLWLTASRSQRRNPSLNRARWGVVLMIAITLLMFGYLTPEIVSLGRSLDFVPRDPAPVEMRRFWILHGAYTSLEMLKLLVAALVAYGIVRSGAAGLSKATATPGL